jgi:hypothetical protein
MSCCVDDFYSLGFNRLKVIHRHECFLLERASHPKEGELQCIPEKQ